MRNRRIGCKRGDYIVLRFAPHKLSHISTGFTHSSAGGNTTNELDAHLDSYSTQGFNVDLPNMRE
jgi:hypothetical protein